jgi:hypothetical protein
MSRRDSERQYLELLAEADPAERGRGFATIAEAIASHDEEFADFDSEPS